MIPTATDVAIIGAGPYGLSIAAHLRQRGVEHRIFGSPMQAWAAMSPGMFLKSFAFATNIYTPQPHYSLPEYCRAHGLEDWEPVEIATFARFGIWVQQQIVPEVEATDVTRLTRVSDRFELALATGERLTARRVVVAAGLSYFERIPKTYAHLPRELASHTAEHGDFSPFAGKQVTVVGGGQSALQAAALLHEHGAQVQMLVRRNIWFSTQMARRRPLKEHIKAPLTVLGPGRDNWVLQHVPMAMHYLPAEKRVSFTRKHLGPAGAWWLRDRVVGKFPVHEWTIVRDASAHRGRVCLRVHEEDVGDHELVTDHVIAGTGYEVDVDKIAFLCPELAHSIRRIERAPDLSSFFESSVRGLYFAGPASAMSFGPLFRFVAGADYAAPLIARHLTWTTRLSRFAVKRARTIEPLPDSAQPTALEVVTPAQRA
jgi:cation diffusion facilitator CzcD-associated flavoprotein CzcO